MIKVSFVQFSDFSISKRRELVENHGALLVSGTPTENAILQTFGASIGNVIQHGASGTDRKNHAEGGIHVVRAFKSPMTDSFGNLILSTTNAQFPLHTDEFYNSKPANIVILLCCIPDLCGGKTLLADVQTVVKTLSTSILNILCRPFVRVPFGYKSVLVKVSSGWQVSYNRYEIEKFASSFEHLYTNEELDALEHFDCAAVQSAIRLPLQKGDCLLIDNSRLLHGRTEVSSNSKRLFKRLRVMYLD